MLLGEVMGGPELNTWLTRLWSSLGPWGTVNKDRLSVALVIPKLSMCLTWAGGLGQGVPVPLPADCLPPSCSRPMSNRRQLFPSLCLNKGRTTFQ